jgi:PKD repeat protein
MKKIYAVFVVLFFFNTVKSQLPCTANFTTNSNGNTVTFSPEVSTTPDSFYLINQWWMFGDGTSSQLSYPSHTYAQCGTYTVYHITRTYDSNRIFICGDTVTQAITISCNTPCGVQAYFQGSPTTNQSNVYEFINSSTVSSPNAGTITSVWNYGDGVTSSSVGLTNQTHTYSSSGTYTVCLYVYISQTPGTVSCADSFCQSIQVVAPNQNPCSVPATFNAVYVQNHPNVFEFTNTSQVDTTLAYATWIFGDGTTGGGDHITHTYTQPGTYNVCMHLNVFNTCSADTCIQINVTASNPCGVQAAFNSVVSNNQPNTYEFINTSIAPDSGSLSYSIWNFGDGSPIVTTAGLGNQSHLYASAGVYQVCLVTTYGQTPGTINCSDTICQEITVNGPTDSCNLFANFIWQTVSGNQSEIHFISTSRGTDSLTNYTWYFGDSSVSNSMNPVHVYQTGGMHYVCLSADNGNGCESEICHLISTSTPLASFPNPAQSNVNVNVTLSQPSSIYATIFNAQSRMVGQIVQAGNNGNNVLSFNVGNLPSGLYTIRINCGNQVYVSRFQKM